MTGKRTPAKIPERIHGRLRRTSISVPFWEVKVEHPVKFIARYAQIDVAIRADGHAELIGV